MIRLAILSFWHVHAKDYAREAVEHPDTEIVAVWDELPERGREEAKQRGVPYFDNLSNLLDQPDIDGVIVVTQTNMHRQVITAAAQAGKHIFTEKVIALTTAECDEIMDIVKKSGVKMTVSLPRLNTDYTQAIQQVLAEGLLGKLTLVRTRLSHNGAIPSQRGPEGWLPSRFYNLEQCGGGAMVDLGCHPMYLARLFLGMPHTVTAHYGYVTSREVEDNAACVLSYPNGALAVVEAGFVNSHSPFVIELHGTDGSLLYSSHDGKLLLRSAHRQEASTDWEILTDLPTAKPSAFEHWVSHIQQDTSAEENLSLAYDLTVLMEASNQSARAGHGINLKK